MNIAQLKERARTLRLETYALYLAGRHPDVPWYAKVIIVITVAYALSPIDLIPDFIPVIGYLDDLVLVPMGIALAIKLVPRHILEQCRAKAATIFLHKKPVSFAGAAFVALLWAAGAWWLGSILWKLVN